MTTLTPENSKSIVKVAALIGWTPDQLANQPLAETLEKFANQNSDSFEGFLGAILLKCRSQDAANRWIGARLKRRLLCYKIQKKADRIIGLQVRALPGAKQVPEPIREPFGGSG